MRILKAGALYFAVVFGVGFVLGIIRVLGVSPRFGERTAEVMESPIMLLVIILAARWVVRRLSLPKTVEARLGAGSIALAFMLAAEFLVVVAVRHISITDYLAGRDVVGGIIYLVMLVIFAAMPLFVAGK